MSLTLYLLVLLFVVGLVEAVTIHKSIRKHSAIQKRSASKNKVPAADAASDEEDGDDDDEDDDADTGMINAPVAPAKPPVAAAPPVAPPVAPVPVAPVPQPVAPKLPPPPPVKPLVMGPPPPPLTPHVDHTPRPWMELEGHLDEVQTRQAQLKSELKLWADHASWDNKIAADEKALAKETTGALADMLGDMRSELHQLAVPVYTDILYENLDSLNEKEHFLKKEIAELKAKDAMVRSAKQAEATLKADAAADAADAAAEPALSKSQLSWASKTKEGTLFMDFMYMLFGAGFMLIAFILVRSLYTPA